MASYTKIRLTRVETKNCYTLRNKNLRELRIVLYGFTADSPRASLTCHGQVSYSLSFSLSLSLSLSLSISLFLKACDTAISPN